MQSYICLVMNGGRLRALGIECADDADALEQATTILNSQPSNQSVEIWHGGRFVTQAESNYSDLSAESNSYPNKRLNSNSGVP
jgi:hypothetical protein